MIIDFEINSSGDLIFREQSVENTSLKVTFALSKTNATKIVFDFNEFNAAIPSRHALKVNFELIKKTANKSVNIIKDKEAMSQLLTLKLKSSLGELPNRPTFGSKLSLLKHKEINKNNLIILESYVKECISDIIINPVVEAKPFIDYNNGYNQTVVLKIYSNNNNILNYVVGR